MIRFCKSWATGSSDGLTYIKERKPLTGTNKI